MVLTSWNDLLPLQRGWCIWELYCTILGLDAKCKFDVAMSPASIEDLDKDPVNIINKMFAMMDTSKSYCYKEEDRERIHEAIRRTIGFKELNKEMFEVMRRWVISKYENRYKSLASQLGVNTLSSMNNLALLYQNQGEYVKAFPLYEECLWQCYVILGESHPDTLMFMNYLAMLYQNQGDYVKALPLYEECLRQSKLISGESHPDTLMFMNNLATLYKNQGEYVKALPLYEECLRQSNIVLGKSHPFTVVSMINLADVYNDQGDYVKALPLYEECISLGKVVLGESHPDTLRSMNDLATINFDQEEYVKALPLYEEWGESC